MYQLAYLCSNSEETAGLPVVESLGGYGDTMTEMFGQVLPLCDQAEVSSRCGKLHGNLTRAGMAPPEREPSV